MNDVDLITNDLNKKGVSFTSTIQRDGTFALSIPFKDGSGFMLVGFDAKQEITDVTMQPAYFPFAYGEEGYSRSNLLSIYRAFVEGRYEVTIGLSLPIIATVRTVITVPTGDGGTLVSSLRVKKNLLPLIVSKKLFV